MASDSIIRGGGGGGGRERSELAREGWGGGVSALEGEAQKERCSNSYKSLLDLLTVYSRRMLVVSLITSITFMDSLCLPVHFCLPALGCYTQL